MTDAPYAGKIFGIGFYKTGTTTLFEALKLLGFRTINGDKPGSYPGADDGETLLKQIEAGDFRLPTFELFDAFTDNPYFRLWREIYAQFPRAKYILTVRDEGPWIESCVSRLVIDVNRAWDNPTLIPAISDRTLIPGNCDLAEDDSGAEASPRPAR